MIPIYRIDIIQDLNPKILTTPSKKLLRHQIEDEGLVDNNEYVNPTAYSWKDCADIIPYEEEIIKIAKKSKTVEDFLDLIGDLEDDIDCGRLADIGVSGTATALVNLGYMRNSKGIFKFNCIPITSYMGGKKLSSIDPEERGYYPHVAGYATPEFGLKLLDLVHGKKIGLRNIEFVEGTGFEVYARSIEDMFNFGKFLYEQRDG